MTAIYNYILNFIMKNIIATVVKFFNEYIRQQKQHKVDHENQQKRDETKTVEDEASATEDLINGRKH